MEPRDEKEPLKDMDSSFMTSVMKFMHFRETSIRNANSIENLIHDQFTTDG